MGKLLTRGLVAYVSSETWLLVLCLALHHPLDDHCRVKEASLEGIPFSYLKMEAYAL